MKTKQNSFFTYVEELNDRIFSLQQKKHRKTPRSLMSSITIFSVYLLLVMFLSIATNRINKTRMNDFNEIDLQTTNIGIDETI